MEALLSREEVEYKVVAKHYYKCKARGKEFYIVASGYMDMMVKLRIKLGIK